GLRASGPRHGNQGDACHAGNEHQPAGKPLAAWDGKGDPHGVHDPEALKSGGGAKPTLRKPACVQMSITSITNAYLSLLSAWILTSSWLVSSARAFLRNLSNSSRSCTSVSPAACCTSSLSMPPEPSGDPLMTTVNCDGSSISVSDLVGSTSSCCFALASP